VKSFRENFVEYAGKPRREACKAILANATGERVMLRCIFIGLGSASLTELNEGFYRALCEQWFFVLLTPPETHPTNHAASYATGKRDFMKAARKTAGKELFPPQVP